jgi:histidinol-phosphate phosphatase family protein
MPPKEIVIMVGFQASGKSTLAAKLATRAPKTTWLHSRDVDGTFDIAAAPAKTRRIIVDATHLTRESRRPILEAAARVGIPAKAVVIESSIEDCQIRALRRMWERHNEIYLTGKGAAEDPNVFPPAALFSARKRYEPPSKEEGFTEITTVTAPRITWDGRRYKKKAVFLDIDGTIRETAHLPNKYPTRPEEVQLRPGIAELLQKWRKDGYILVGISNQSGISKGTLTAAAAEACFARTRELLGYSEKEFPILFCPHRAAPISCYCRKPQVGNAVLACERWRINPAKSLMIGDMKTDETMTTRMGIKFKYATDL